MVPNEPAALDWNRFRPTPEGDPAVFWQFLDEKRQQMVALVLIEQRIAEYQGQIQTLQKIQQIIKG